MSFDYISYSIKTFGQDKYRLIINTKDKITNNPIGNVTIDVIYITDSEEKKIVSGKSNRDGTIVFYLLPGYYKCEGSGIFLGETDILDLRENEEIDLKIWIPIR